jgi:hypothetical protein
MRNPDKYAIATEILSGAIKTLQAAGFDEQEVLALFAQASKKRGRVPLYLTPLDRKTARAQ